VTWQLARTIVRGSPNKVIARLSAPDGRPVTVRRKHLPHVALLSRERPGGWQLRVPHKPATVGYEGEAALQIAGRLLPSLNRFGGTREQVSEAVRLLDEEPDPLRYFGRAAAHVSRGSGAAYAKIASLPDAVRLALEMASHEESERRAFEGELAALEDAWRDAEEIAAIADDMFLPQSVLDFIRRHRPER